MRSPLLSMTAVLAAAVMTGALVAAGPAVAATLAPAPATVLPIQSQVRPGVNITNSHWSGYDAMHGDFTSVSASWTQPTVNCSQGGDVVFWVGLGGGTASSDSLQQNGTFAQCEGSTAVYSAWWETWPCNAITQYGGTVKPGDKITASTVNEGSNRYVLTVTDSTEGWSVHPTETGCNGGTTATAEVITETPEIGGGLADLPDFGKVTYTSATINGSPLADASPTKVIIARGGVHMDTTTAIKGGNSFSNVWKANS
jgi:Peptidase A4 family